MTYYQHLSDEEGFYIHQAVRDGKGQVEIARALGRAIPLRLVERNDATCRPSAYLYTYDWARYFQRHHQRRAHAQKHRTLTGRIKTMIVALLKRYLSPEQISAYLKTHHAVSLSHETIYRFIRSGFGNSDSVRNGSLASPRPPRGGR